jgi:chitin disaccharide deacetylase
VLHADDVGMCHGANVAFSELSHFGTITSGSVMVPCPWFLESAAIAASHNHLDMGVHLTLNAEKTHYKWGPAGHPSRAAGLTDENGHLWRHVRQVREHAHPDAVEQEWRTQIEIAIANGIDITHLDTHMGSALAPEWCDRYINLGVEYQIPVLMPATLAAYGPNKHLDGVSETEFGGFVAHARSVGMPVFDVVPETDFRRDKGAPMTYAALIDEAVTPGNLVYCAFHPNAPGEIDAIDPKNGYVRIDEHQLFQSSEWRNWLTAQPFELVAMRDLPLT